MIASRLLERLGLSGWEAALAALAAAALLAFLVRLAGELFTRSWARRAGARSHAAVLDAVRRPVTLLLFLVGVRFSLELADLPDHRLAEFAMKSVVVLTVFVAAFAFGAGLIALLQSDASPRLAPMRGFLAGVIRGTVGLLAILIALEAIGVSVTPVLASLGVGSLAVALALQDTLGNFFAGIALLADRPVRVGEWVRVDPDIEGRVSEIGWRTTSILDLQQNLVLVPNGTLAKAVVRNFDRPETGETASVRIVLEHATPIAAALAAVEEAVRPLGGSALVTAIEPAGIQVTATFHVKERSARATERSRALVAVAEALERARLSPARAVFPPTPTPAA